MNSRQKILRTRSWALAYLLEFGLFSALAIFGAYGAISAGISADEQIELNTYLMNLAAVKGLIGGDFGPYQALISYHDRYYGVGFHLISHGLSNFLNTFTSPLLRFSELGSRLAWNHLANFTAFMFAGVIFRQCLFSLTKDKFVAALGMFTFLLWPYLLGHALMNVKDIPFLLVWLGCTYQILRVFEMQDRPLQGLVINFVLLGLLTGWLISIRVSGVLIFIQYFWFGFFWVRGTLQEGCSNIFLKRLPPLLGIFLLATAIALFILYPILWHNPFEFLNAMSYMSSHPWQGNTLTAGEFIEPKTRLFFYLFSWLLVKLPLGVLVGLICLPVALYLNRRNNKISSQKLMIYCLVLSVGSIIFILAIKRVALYNELRQVLFIFPLLLLISIYSLFTISRKLAIVTLLVTNVVMCIDDVDLHPYQYAYINEVMRNAPLGEKYEADYFGLSVAETARWMNNSELDSSSQCLYVPSVHQWRYEISPLKFPCVEGYPGDLSLITKPFLFFVQPRGNVKYAAPKWCELRHVELRQIPLSRATIRAGELYECRPK